MKKSFFLLALCLMVSMSGLAQGNPKPFVVPELTSWSGGDGHLALSRRVIARSGGKALPQVAASLASDFNELFANSNATDGQPMTVAKGKAQDGDVVLALVKDKSLGDEGYRMTIGDRVTIEAQTARGAYWGTRTLLQLLEQDERLPKGVTTDVPQYRLRGFMLDVGRKFIPIAYLRNLVKVMSYYKLNALQLHLNDNGFRQYFNYDWNQTPAAFRLECDTYPGLAAKDGHYSKAEFIDLQKLAESDFVNVIPEIDAPAHVLAFTHYKPELGNEKYGMDHFDLAKPEVYTFMDALWKEYLGGKEPVFRGKTVNMGTDEYSNATPQLVKDFRTFTDHYLGLLEQYGKRPMIWGSLTHAKGDTPVRVKGVLMQLWSRDYANPLEMKDLGYQLVSIPDGFTYIVPAAGYYYDYLNTQWLYDHWTPANVNGVQLDENDPQLEGGMFAVWNDHYGNGVTVADIHDRLMPALQTMTTKCWTGRLTSLPYEEFNQKRVTLHEAPGVNEAGRLPIDAIDIKDVRPGMTNLAGTWLSEVGFGHSVSFDIDCQPEEKGTVLTTFTGREGDNSLGTTAETTFYLSDPRTGRLGFTREGYLNTFNYALPKEGKVSIRLEMTNNETRLFVDGKHRQTLRREQMIVWDGGGKYDYLPSAEYKPTVYRANGHPTMYYMQTLHFPLGKTGTFKSKVTNLKVE